MMNFACKMHAQKKCSGAPLRVLHEFTTGSPPQQQQEVRRVPYRLNCSLAELLGGQAGQPAVITGAMGEGWPALQWSPEELLSRSSDISVPVEASSNGGDYRDLYNPRPGSTRAFEAGLPVPLSLLLQHMRDEEQQQRGEKGSTQPGRADKVQPAAPLRLYLAQRDVAEALPALAQGVPRAPPFAELAQRMHQRSVWLGPRGTQTPLHRDPYHNLLCQVWGSKLIRMYAPEHTPSLYPFADPFLRNTSQVNVLEPDLRAHAKFADAPGWECMLGPGEMLFIPQRWWHFVASASASLSISFWWTQPPSSE